MTTIAAPTGTVTVGVDTHMDVHVAAVNDLVRSWRAEGARR